MATAAWFWMPLVVFQGFHAVDLFFAQRISSSSLREACRGTSAVDYDTFHAVAATLLAANTACVAFQFLYITRAKVRAHTRASRLAGRTGAFFDGIVEAKLARLDFIAGTFIFFVEDLPELALTVVVQVLTGQFELLDQLQVRCPPQHGLNPTPIHLLAPTPTLALVNPHPTQTQLVTTLIGALLFLLIARARCTKAKAVAAELEAGTRRRSWLDLFRSTRQAAARRDATGTRAAARELANERTRAKREEGAWQAARSEADAVL